MIKKWIKYYLLLGTIIMLILAFAGSYFFIDENVNQAEQKRTFDSIYTDTAIDFVVPSPTQQQVQELDHSSANGIEAISPYYATKSNLIINGNGVSKGTAIVIPDNSELEYTPYVPDRILKGDTAFGSGDAIVDNMFSALNKCGIGDKVSISLSGNTFEFSIVSIAEDNTLFKDGTVALVLSTEQNELLISGGLSYSAAYIKASDYTKCKDYLYNDYKPMGKLKDQSSFDDLDAFSLHLENFNSADWSQEITNLRDNYDTLKIKYENVESGVLFNNIVFVIIVAAVIVIINLYFATNKSIKQFMRTYLIKKNGTKSKIAGFYKKGILFNLVVFAASVFALYYYMIQASTLTVKNTLVNYVYPVGAALASSILMMIITQIIVSASYSMKKNEHEDIKESKSADATEQ